MGPLEWFPFTSCCVSGTGSEKNNLSEDTGRESNHLPLFPELEKSFNWTSIFLDTVHVHIFKGID